MNSRLRSAFILITGLSIAGLILVGMNSYPGSKLLYLMFSASFSLMLFTSFNKRTHYGYLFLIVTLWLGFWGKITAHLILDYPYVEPVGQFDGSAAAWDEVLLVAIVASIGVMLGKLAFGRFSNSYSREMRCDQYRGPAWYPAARKWIWLLAATGIVGVAIANMVLGIQQIGLTPRTILPWPLNALIAWQVSIGSALLLTVLLWWEVALRKNIAVSIYAPLLEAGLSASSLLSRGIYIFHTLPQLFALLENRKFLNGLSRMKVAVLIFFLGCLMMLAIGGVTTFRAYLYPHVGGFTTEEQMRLTRLEVLEGGISRVKKLIAKGEPQEAHLRELLVEKAQLERLKQEARLEVLAGGIAHVKQLILKGEPQEGHRQELLAEKARIEGSLAIANSGATDFANVILELNRQKIQSRLEVLAGGIAHVEKLILKGESQEEHLQELLAEKAGLEKTLHNQTEVGKAQEPSLMKEVRVPKLSPPAVHNPPRSNENTPGEGVVEAEVAANKVLETNTTATDKKQLFNEFMHQVGSGAIYRILSLSVDRWIGLEGVMAVVAYPDKSVELLKEAALEKREVGTATKFQIVANSHYRWTDSSQWQFASLPGSAAFLFFSGSMWVVLLGMALFVIVLQLSEQLVFKLTANPLLCSLFGFTLANTIAQFGVAPRQDIPFYAMIVCFVLLVHVVQSEKIYEMVRNSISARSDRRAD